MISTPRPKRIVVGISGASGALYGVRALELLAQAGVETHLVISRAARLTLMQETGCKPADVVAKASAVYAVQDVGAAIASGSFVTDGMLIAPCSVRTLSEIVTGVTSSLLTRAADVTLKERRRLVLMVRETPLHLGHLRSMVAVTEMGAVVLPPVPALYVQPVSIDTMITQTAGRALDVLGVHCDAVSRWQGLGEPPRA